MSSTVDNALLSCRSSVLLWADIRASMSSSSSENSCGRQHLGLMKRRTASGKLAKALHTAALRGRKRASSVNLIRQVRMERGNLFTRFSHTVTMSSGLQYICSREWTSGFKLLQTLITHHQLLRPPLAFSYSDYINMKMEHYFRASSLWFRITGVFFFYYYHVW